MTELLLLFAVVILICILCNKASVKLGVPALLLFILLGMFFGTDGIIKIHFENYEFAEEICSVALIFIMFYGGFGTKWQAARPVAVPSIIMSSAGTVLTAMVTGLFCHFALQMSLLEGLLIGAVISSTDAASVFSILRSKKLSLLHATDSLLEVESGSNDPFSYMLTAVLLSVMGGGANAGTVAYMLFAQLVYGIALGALIAAAAVYILRNISFATDGFDTIFVLAVALLAYALPNAVGGNGYLSAYIVGIVLGNTRIPNKKPLVGFFDGFTGLMQMVIFFLLGLLATPSQMPAVALQALGVALFLTIIARPLVVFLLLTPLGCPRNQKLLVAWSGLRGASSIVFAIMATIQGTGMQTDVFHIVFFIVLVSISCQGTLIPQVAKRLHMIDESGDVRKTFNDYTEEEAVQFIKLVIGEAHPWRDNRIADIHLPPDTLLVLILRQGQPVIPGGQLVLLEGDVAVLSAPTFHDDGVTIALTEHKLGADSGMIGKEIKEVHHEHDGLILMIKRGEERIIPNGATRLEENDIIVSSEMKAG